MAVYTEIQDDELDAFVKSYDIGELLSIKGIAEGVENSNFLVHTSQDHYILTLYEKRVDAADLPFFLALMEHTHANGVKCPLPIKNKNGVYLNSLAGKPAVIVTFLQGMSIRKPSSLNCSELGSVLAQFHIANSTFLSQRFNSLSIDGWKELTNKIMIQPSLLTNGLDTLIKNSLNTLTQEWPERSLYNNIPEGIIHADLFPNNVLFLGTKISGIIDFYFGCTDYLAYDVAICINSWCFEPDHSFNVTKAQNLLCAYHKIRPLSSDEIKLLPIFLRGSALRFLLTRSYDAMNCPKNALVTTLDPIEYAKKLSFHNTIRKFEDYGIRIKECA